MGHVLGSLFDGPFKIGSVFWSTELSIVSAEKKGTPVPTRINSLNNFDADLYRYIFLSVTLISLWFTFFSVHDRYEEKRSKIRSRKKIGHEKRVNLLIRSLFYCIRRSFGVFFNAICSGTLALIDEQSYKVTNGPNKVLIGFFYAGIFNIVFGFFLNLISVDMVATPPVDNIETLSDLVDRPMYKDVKVFVPGGLWHEASIRSSLEGSPVRRLADRIGDGYFPMQTGHGYPDRVAETLGSLAQWR